MAHCDEYLELISAAIDGALSPAQRKKLETHLAQCPECGTLYAQLSNLHTALVDLPPVEVPAGLHERIMAAVAAEQVLPFAPAETKKSPIRWQRWLASAAVLAVVLLGTWSWKPWETVEKNTEAPMAAEAQPAQSVVTGTARESLPAEEAAPADTPDMASLNAEEAADLPAASSGPSLRSLPADSSTAAKMAPEPEPEQDSAVIEGAAAPQMASRDTGAPLLGAAPKENAEIGDTLPVPALFSAPVPTQIPGIPEEDGGSAPRSFMVAANGIANETESPDITAQEALERLVAYIFEYSSYDSVEYISGEEGLSAHVAAQGSGGDILLLPQQEDETLYRFEFRPETGGVYSYTVCRLTGEIAFLSEE